MKATSSDRSEELGGRLDTPTTSARSSAATGTAPEAAAQLLAGDHFWRRWAAACAAGSSAAARVCSGGMRRAGRALRGRAAQGAQLGQLGAWGRARGPLGGLRGAYRSRSSCEEQAQPNRTFCTNRHVRCAVYVTCRDRWSCRLRLCVGYIWTSSRHARRSCARCARRRQRASKIAF